MHTRLLDAFTDLSDWMAVTSGQARLDITSEPGPHGQAQGLAMGTRFGGDIQPRLARRHGHPVGEIGECVQQSGVHVGNLVKT